MAEEYNENQLLIVSYHLADAFSTVETGNRVSWYLSLPAEDYWLLPTVFFDGGVDFHTGYGDVYSEYKSIIEAHLPQETPVFIELSGFIIEGVNGFLTAEIFLFDDIPSENVYVDLS